MRELIAPLSSDAVNIPATDHLPLTPRVPPVRLQPRPRPSFLGPAIATLGAYLGTQGAFGAVVGAFVGVHAGVRAALAHQSFSPADVQSTALAPSLVLSLLLSSGAVFALVLLWTRGMGARITSASLGLLRTPRVPVLLGLLSGLVVALAALYLSPLLAPEPELEALGPIAVALSKPGAARVVFAIFAICLAPVVEEVLFRGVLFAGLSQRFSPASSAAIVTALFLAVHVTQYWRYWPALLFVLLLGVILAIARVRFGSIAPGIAAHFSYNLLAVAFISIP